MFVPPSLFHVFSLEKLSPTMLSTTMPCSLLFQRTSCARVSSSSFARSFVPRFQPSTRTRRRDDDVRDITPAGERESPMEQRGKGSVEGKREPARKREKSKVKRGGGKGERESSRREGTKVDGRRDKVGQRLSNGLEQVPGPLLTSPRPPVGGERVTVRASGHGRHLVFG